MLSEQLKVATEKELDTFLGTAEKTALIVAKLDEDGDFDMQAGGDGKFLVGLICGIIEDFAEQTKLNFGQILGAISLCNKVGIDNFVHGEPVDPEEFDGGW
jgi:hypothetical protein